MHTSLDDLRYLNKSAPLEHKLTFNELQARPTGFQTAIPVDTTLEQMNSAKNFDATPTTLLDLDMEVDVNCLDSFGIDFRPVREQLVHMLLSRQDR